MSWAKKDEYFNPYETCNSDELILESSEFLYIHDVNFWAKLKLKLIILISLAKYEAIIAFDEEIKTVALII